TGQDQTGAAFIVLTMMGINGNDPAIGGSTANGVALARSLYANWAAMVTAYAGTPGKVEWNHLMTYPVDGTPTYLNSEYQGRHACGGANPPDTKDPNDDTFYSDDTPQTHPTIIFHNADGSRYMIKRNCGNPIGPFKALDQPDFNVNLTATGTP